MRTQKCIVFVIFLLFLSFSVTKSQDIDLELVMPETLFGPGSNFYLDLVIMNTGPYISNAQLFVALTVGTGDFWFYPGWVQYPPDIDWSSMDIALGFSGSMQIIPEFSWPSNAGAFDGAMFLSAVTDSGGLVSNLAEITFGWTDSIVPTPTPTSGPVPLDEEFIRPEVYARGSWNWIPCMMDDETMHTVTLTRGFYMMTTEVSRQLWADLRQLQPDLPADPSDVSVGPGMDHPVQSVTWHEAILFANLMSLQNGYEPCYFIDSSYQTPVNGMNYQTDDIYWDFDAEGYRLPTEAEWELAARAGTIGPFSFDEPDYDETTCDSCDEGILPKLAQYAIYCGNVPIASGSLTAPVGSLRPNRNRLYDIYGNVWEWCWDWYGDYPSGSVTDPIGPESGTMRVMRGGAWNESAKGCRSATRGHWFPDRSLPIWGIRLVRTVHDIPNPTPTPTPLMMQFAAISSGEYTRGSPENEPCRDIGTHGETQHHVTLTRNFLMMTTTVTRHMWADLKTVQPDLPDDPSKPDASPSMDHPVQNITWFEAVLFANLKSLADGLDRCYYADAAFTIPIDAGNYLTSDIHCYFGANGYRLPTEAEWEYAARAGTTGPFSFNEPFYDSWTCAAESCIKNTLPNMEQHAVFCANYGWSPAAVGSKMPNPWGLYDMHGHVWEWCWDWYDGDYPSHPVVNPTGPDSGAERIARGGSLGTVAAACRSAQRARAFPFERAEVLGFRLVQTTH